MSYRTLRELDEEAKAEASSLSKKKSDTAFLQQKSEQYKKQVATLEVISDVRVDGLLLILVDLVTIGEI